MVAGQQIRTKRVLAGISGAVLCSRAGIGRGRLSAIERGYISISAEQLARIEAALDQLVAAKKRIDELARELGWPSSAEAATVRNARADGTARVTA